MNNTTSRIILNNVTLMELTHKMKVFKEMNRAHSLQLDEQSKKYKIAKKYFDDIKAHTLDNPSVSTMRKSRIATDNLREETQKMVEMHKKTEELEENANIAERNYDAHMIVCQEEINDFGEMIKAHSLQQDKQSTKHKLAKKHFDDIHAYARDNPTLSSMRGLRMATDDLEDTKTKLKEMTKKAREMAEMAEIMGSNSETHVNVLQNIYRKEISM